MDAAGSERAVLFGQSEGGPMCALFAATYPLNNEIDVRHVLPAIRVPALVLHRIGDQDVRVEEGRYIASQIPGSRYVELAGADHDEWVGDADAVLSEVQEFVTGVRPQGETERLLMTVLFTAIVGSTDLAVSLGDRRWRELLESHNAIVRRELLRLRGREVKTAGDGFLATFDGPARAIRCARAICAAIRQLGIEGAGEVLVSSTVRDLVAGSGLVFEDRGLHPLKGISGEWRLFAVRE